MNFSRWIATVAVIATGCRDVVEPPVRVVGASELGLTVGRLDAPVGSRVAITIALPADGSVGAIQARLGFDPGALEYLGQGAPGAPAVLVGDAGADHCSIKVVALDVDGLPAEIGPFVFLVKRADYPAGLTLQPEIVTTGAGAPIRGVRSAPLAVTGRTPPADQPRKLRLADWIAVFETGEGPDGPQRLPGAGTVFGDVNLNGAINVFDVLAVQNAAAGNLSVLSGLTTDFVDAGNVAPANLPGLGDASDPVPPGADLDGGRSLNVFDALAIANFAAGNGDPIAGNLIPGRIAPTGRAVLSGVIGADRTLARDTVYELDGTVIVPGGVTLTIEAGTRIEGQSATRGHLSIRRNAVIQALGTRFQPIVFTCASASPAPGCWGGVTLNGAALLNNPQVLGCPTRVEPSGGTYGGCLVDHSSGGLRYVRIEWAGAPWPGGGEAAGLSLNGIGTGTFLEDVQVHRSAGDGVFVSGGRAQLRELFVSQPGGDGIEWTDGWQGKVQGLVVLRSSGAGSALLGSNAAGLPVVGPRSHPTFYNGSIVALNPGGSTTAPAIHLREGTGGAFRNLLLQGWTGTGLEIDDQGTCDRIAADSLDLSSSLFFGNATDFSADSDCADEPGFATAPPRNNLAGADPGLLDPGFQLSPDLRPAAGSPAGTGANPPADGFFDVLRSYRGAVPPANATRANIPWYAGWTVGQ